MAEMDDLLNAVTDEHGIPADFLEAVRTAYDNDMSLHITTIGERDATIAENASILESTLAAHADEIAQLNSAHESAINSVKAENYDKIMNGSGVEITDATPDADDTVNDYDDDKTRSGLWTME